jgi:peptide/nickel transport system substrate-binding protein
VIAPRRPFSVSWSHVAAALVGSIGIVTIAACSGSAPESGSVLHLASVAEPPGLNPMVFDNAQVTYFSPLFHGFLLRTDADGRLIPDLAGEVPTHANGGISSDGRTITYHLRHGIKWQDGAPFDSRDVVFSYHAVMNPNNSVPDRTGFDQIADVRALGVDAVRVRLKAPFTPFLPSFFTLAANDPYPILPAHLLAGKHDINRDPYNALPIGLGPYKVVKWERGTRITLAADPNYFFGKPAIDRIEISFVPNTNTLETLWQTGKVDLIVARAQAGRAFLDAVRRVAGTHTVLHPHNEFDFLLFNLKRPALDDLRVRQAIVAGFDRLHALRTLDGDLTVPGDSDRLPGQFAYDPTIVQATFDPKRSAALLDAAGWKLVNGTRMKNGRPLTFDYVATTESPSTERIGLLLQQDLAKLGIRVAIKSYSYNLIFASAAEHGIYQTGRFDLTYSGWQPNEVNDHSYLFRCDTRPPAGDNFGNICDPLIDRAAAEELKATDPAREAAGDRAIARRLVDRSDLVFLGFVRDGVAHRDGLEGIAPSVTGLHYWNAYEWKWAPLPR